MKPDLSNTTSTKTSIVPAQLFIIADQQAQHYVVNQLQTILCKQNRCTTCIICTQIAQHQSPAVCWIAPETRYTLDTFDVLFKKISFVLEPGTEFFFVIEQAHLLSGTCANALLKIVEEPPTGYHFIFTASTLQGVLPTLRSRCQTKLCTRQGSSENSLLFPYFTQQTNAIAFLKTLTTCTISEFETMSLIETLIEYYTRGLLSNTISHAVAQPILEYLQHHLQQGIMTGGTKIFLKDLYLVSNAARRAHGVN